ncbi:MAG: hypothetical protein F4X58_06590 [Chloroflexi bacterium]|nr:hypothetical protein [Chloroflexota bacterium]MYC01571.1 hypothetical protein [Chloroflexota bacterium]
MNQLEPAIDAYGSYARASVMADFLELWALHGIRRSWSDIADYIEDNGWNSKVHETFVERIDAGGEESEDADLGADGEEAVDRVYAQIEARQAYLGSAYPFSFDAATGIVEVVDLTPSPYLALLALTVAHAYSVQVEHIRPHEVFEDTVVRALTEAGHRSVNFARIRASSSGFREALLEAGRQLSLRASPDGTYASKWAQDEGADAIVHIDSGFSTDGAVGAWILVGQATCGKSNTWRQKMGEVQDRDWEIRLDTLAPPMAFLAVPHHAEVGHLNKLVGGSRRLVLDRLRLATMLRSVSDKEQSLLTRVKDTEIMSP